MDVAAVAAGASVVAAGAAAWQLWLLRTDRLDARAAEIDGVSLMMTVRERPTEREFRNGLGRFVYDFDIYNPGRLPISNVTATVLFPYPVQRSRNDGGIEKADAKLIFGTPVIAPGGTHSRRRALLVPAGNLAALEAITATVSFVTADVGEHTTAWPTHKTHRSRALRRRLDRTRGLQ